MISEQAERDIRNDENKLNRERSAKYRHTNEKAFRAFMELVSGGATDEEAYKVIQDRFEVGKRRMDNIRNKMSGTASPETKAMNEGILAVHLTRTLSACEEAIATCDHDILGAVSLLDQGEEWVGVEQTDGSDDKKGNSQKTKKVRTAQHIRDLEDRKIEKYQQFIQSVGQLVNRQEVTVVDNNAGLKGLSLEALGLQEKAIEKKLKIGEGDEE